MTVRALTVVMRLDAAGYTSGTQQAIGQTRAMTAEIQAANQIIASSERLRKAPRESMAAARQLGIKEAAGEGNTFARLVANQERLALSRTEPHAAAWQALFLKRESERAQAAAESNMAEVEAARKATQAKVSAAMGDYRTRVMLEDRIYAASHSRREVDLANLQSYYARMRAQHSGNAKMLSLIDQSYAAERGALMGGGTLSAGAGRRAARFAAVQIAGQISPEAGQIGGMATMGGMMTGTAAGAVAFAGIAASAALAAASIRSYTESLRRSAEEMERLSKSGREFTRAMTAEIPTTARGQRAREGLKQAEAERELLTTRGKEMDSLWWKVKNWAPFGADRGFEQRRWNEELLDQEQRKIKGLAETERRERAVHLTRERNALAESALAARHAGIDEPLLRSAAELRMRQKRELEEFERRQDERRAAGLKRDEISESMLAQKHGEERANRDKAILDTQKNNWRKYADYRQQINEELESGAITQEQSRILLAQRMGQLMSDRGIGQPVDMASRWMSIQSAIARPDDTAKMTLDEMRLMHEEIKGLRREGLVLKAG